MKLETYLVAASATVIHGEGGTCGGFINDPPVCAPGLVCVHTSQIADLPGVCRKPSKTVKSPSTTTTQHVNGEGGSCGGFILNPPVCSPGLTCVYSNVPDLPGTCTLISPSPTQQVNGVGGACGGFILNPPVCSPGLVCVHTNPIADLPGTCVQPAKSTKTVSKVAPTPLDS
ncbi:hypothetical protein HK098_005004 [Nowakowskiella sp. JEL0407]|nr:hypothetical protein HK098_005004 [Nowakowskiella sp. JEL0407]